MHSIPSAALSLAARLYGLSGRGTVFARSHQHSSATIFRFRQRDRNVLLKINCAAIQPRTTATLAQLRFAEELNQTGIHCIHPLRSLQGNILEHFKLDQQGYDVYAWPQISGRPLADLHPSELRDYYQRWARLLAELHTVAASDQMQAESPILPDARRILHWHREWDDCAYALHESEIKAVWQKLRDRLDALPCTRVNFGLIHNDAHPQNILDDGQTLHLIDFDRACYHFFAMDIANSIYSEYSRIGFHSKHKAALSDLAQHFLKPFINSYLKYFDLPKADLKQIELFLAYRRILMYSIFYQEIKAAAPEYLRQFKAEIIAARPFLKLNLLDLISDTSCKPCIA